jgi:hypothetical protein
MPQPIRVSTAKRRSEIMARTIQVGELHPCDVFLYHGNSTVSQLIQWFSSSEYSHSSIFDGSKVVEAVTEGVLSRSIAESVVHTVHVDVWRLKKWGHPIGSPELPAEPVLSVVANYEAEGGRFAYEQVLLLALLCTTRRLPLPFLRWVLDGAAALLENLIDEKREPMVCSELVFRCFSEAGSEYVPRIRGVDIRAKVETLHMPDRPLSQMSESDRAVAEFLDRYAAARGGRSGVELLASALEADPNFITPCDLQHSPDFTRIGRLEFPS